MPRRSTEIIHQSSHKPPKKRNWRTATRKNKKKHCVFVWCLVCVCVCLSALWPFACVLSSSRVLVALHCNWPRLVSFHAHFHDLAKLKASTRSPTLSLPHHHPTTTTTTICWREGRAPYSSFLVLVAATFLLPFLLPFRFLCQLCKQATSHFVNKLGLSSCPPELCVWLSFEKAPPCWCWHGCCSCSCSPPPWPCLHTPVNPQRVGVSSPIGFVHPVIPAFHVRAVIPVFHVCPGHAPPVLPRHDLHPLTPCSFFLVLFFLFFSCFFSCFLFVFVCLCL